MKNVCKGSLYDYRNYSKVMADLFKKIGVMGVCVCVFKLILQLVIFSSIVPTYSSVQPCCLPQP